MLTFDINCECDNKNLQK